VQGFWSPHFIQKKDKEWITKGLKKKKTNFTKMDAVEI